MGTPDHNKRLPLAFASYEPHHGRSTDGQTVRSKDTTKAPGTSRVTPAGDSKLRNARPAASHIINQALIHGWAVMNIRPLESESDFDSLVALDAVDDESG